MLRSLRVPALLAFILAAACSNPNGLQTASLTNLQDTLTLWSLERGPLNKPNAYSLDLQSGVRTWEAGANFEFVFSMDSTGQARFIPTAALGLSSSGSVKPGLLKSTAPLDSMKKAPANGYLTTDTIPIVEGDRFFLRTEVLATCSILGVPLYGKLEILDIDSVAGTVQLIAVADQNCGYRGLVANSVPRS
jgi:hypothetical protein